MGLQARRFAAFCPRGKAAIAESAPLRKLAEVGHSAGDGGKQVARLAVFRRAPQQADRIGMHRAVDQRLRGTALYHAARIHYVHSVAELGHYGHIMADNSTEVPLAFALCFSNRSTWS